jgi:hypothetical protein
MRVARIFLFIFILFYANFSSAQDTTINKKIYLKSASKKYFFYFELTGNKVKVYSLNKWYDKAGTGYSMAFSDSLSNNEYSGAQGVKISLRSISNKQYLVLLRSLRKQKRIKIDKNINQQLFNTDINNGYWWSSFSNLCVEINLKYAFYRYDFRKGFELWESFPNKAANHEDFKLFVDSKIKFLRDNLISFHTNYMQEINEIFSIISTIDYSSLKNHLLRLSNNNCDGCKYFESAIEKVSSTRPEFFFKLAEDVPEIKNVILGTFIYRKETITILRNIPSDSPIKAEFFRKVKDEKILTTKMLILPTLLLGVLVYVIIK